MRSSFPARAILWLACVLAPALAACAGDALLLAPDRVFDGVAMHTDWKVLVSGDRIVAAGPRIDVPANARTLNLAGMTLLPGLIEGHGHLFLHPYNETPWDDQVLHESLALR